jgi:hypothetical protein
MTKTTDTAARRKSVRKQRDRGATIYIPKDILAAAGIDPDAPPPAYRLTGYRRSKSGHTVIVSLYPAGE